MKNSGVFRFFLIALVVCLVIVFWEDITKPFKSSQSEEQKEAAKEDKLLKMESFIGKVMIKMESYGYIENI